MMQAQQRKASAQQRKASAQHDSDDEADNDNTPAKPLKAKFQTLETPGSADQKLTKTGKAVQDLETASGNQRAQPLKSNDSDEEAPSDEKAGAREVKPLNLADVSSERKKRGKHEEKSTEKAGKPGSRKHEDSRDSKDSRPARQPRMAPNNGKYMLIPEGYILTQPTHPGACFFHLVFKIVGVFCYMFLGLIVTSTLTNFLTVFGSIILDFWVTKNITGRILAGYRWWNDMDDEGEEIWYYESYDYELRFQPIDTNVFWWGMGLNTIFWSIMCVLKVISLNFLWGLLTIVAAMLNWMNFYAYWKCHRAHHSKLSGLTSGLNQMFNPLAGNTAGAEGYSQSKGKQGREKQDTELRGESEEEEEGGNVERGPKVIVEGGAGDKGKKKLFGLF